MERIDAFEAMLSDIQKQAAYETEQMERLKAAGKEKTATYRQHPVKAVGFISVGSVPFGDYYSKSDMFWLSQLEWMCRMFPDRLLRSSIAKICGATETARKRMFTMLSSYTKNELCHLMYVGEAAFIPENKKLDIPCRTILLLGDKDKVGKVAAYNKEWSQRTGFPLIMIQGAAHNANDDQPVIVNGIILDFIKKLTDRTGG